MKTLNEYRDEILLGIAIGAVLLPVIAILMAGLS